MNSMMGNTNAAGRALQGNAAGSKYMAGGKAPKGYKNFQNFDPQMMELFQSLFGHLGPDSFLSRLAGGDQEGFDEMEAPALRQFQGMQGQLASRFSGAGMGARRGSGFQNSLNQQTSDFAQDLQSKRQQMQINALRELMGFSSDLLKQQPYSLIKKDRQPSFMDSIMSSAGQNIGQIPGAAAKWAMGGF
jgi:hypothetical protein